MSDSRHPVWVADDDDAIRWVLQKALQKAGICSELYEDAESVIAAMDAAGGGVVLHKGKMIDRPVLLAAESTSSSLMLRPAKARRIDLSNSPQSR